MQKNRLWDTNKSKCINPNNNYNHNYEKHKIDSKFLPDKITKMETRVRKENTTNIKCDDTFLHHQATPYNP